MEAFNIILRCYDYFRASDFGEEIIARFRCTFRVSSRRTFPYNVNNVNVQKVQGQPEHFDFGHLFDVFWVHSFGFFCYSCYIEFPNCTNLCHTRNATCCAFRETASAICCLARARSGFWWKVPRSAYSLQEERSDK